MQQLPATLNGFYLWLCERAFAGVDFQRDVRPFFSALVREKVLPYDEALEASFPALPNLVQTRPLLEHILSISTGERRRTVTFFHHSFAMWLTDLKLCTRRFIVDDTTQGQQVTNKRQQPKSSPSTRKPTKQQVKHTLFIHLNKHIHEVWRRHSRSPSHIHHTYRG